jgi:hypothetical protein
MTSVVRHGGVAFGLRSEHVGAAALQTAIIASLTFAFLGGKYSFSRFFVESAANPFLELRLWFTAIAVAGLAIRRNYFRETFNLSANAQAQWVVGVVVLMNLAFLIHVTLFGATDSRAGYAVDMFYVAIHAALFAYTIRTQRDLLLMVYLIEVIGIALFILAIAHVGNRDLNGEGWAPFGTTITFHRIQYLVFCCAMFASVVKRDRKLEYVHLAIAAIGLFSAFSSLSKAALFGAVIVSGYTVLALLVLKEFRRAFAYGLLFASVLVVFAAIWWPSLRLSSADPRASEFASQGLVRQFPTTPSLDGAKRLENATRETDSSEHSDDELARLNLMIIADRTQRIRMLVHAWDMFRNNPVWGAGFGFFQIRVLASDGRRFEYYRYPHNIVAELLASTGIFGTCIFASAIGLVIVVVHWSVRTGCEWLYLAAYPLSILVTSLFGGDIYDFRGFWILGAVIAAVGGQSVLSNAGGRSDAAPNRS